MVEKEKSGEKKKKQKKKVESSSSEDSSSSGDEKKKKEAKKPVEKKKEEINLLELGEAPKASAPATYDFLTGTSQPIQTPQTNLLDMFGGGESAPPIQ